MPGKGQKSVTIPEGLYLAVEGYVEFSKRLGKDFNNPTEFVKKAIKEYLKINLKSDAVSYKILRKSINENRPIEDVLVEMKDVWAKEKERSFEKFIKGFLKESK